VRLGSWRPEDPGPATGSSFSHDDEKASGVLLGMLKDYGHSRGADGYGACGLHRYTFPRERDSHIVLDLAHAYGKDMWSGAAS